MFKKIIGAACASLLGASLCLADGVGTAGPAQFSQRDGEHLYQALCQSCHMPEGKGAVGAGHYPPLANNGNLVSSMFLAEVIMYGQRGMPGFGGVLDDEQIVGLVNYIRSHFGNDYRDKITEENIRFIRRPGYEYADMD